MSEADALEARAKQNAQTIEGWTLEKQRRYEDFLQAEKEAEKAEGERRKATREARDMALVASLPKTEPPPVDPWQQILSEIESMPSVTGALERANGYVRVTSRFLLDKVLGISREKVIPMHTLRLSRVMESLGWEKPPNIRVGTLTAKGYRKPME